jgi:lipoyl(octanoyl) transferase
VTMEDVDVALRRAFEDVFGGTRVRLPEATP